jgi:hypothetical protein
MRDHMHQTEKDTIDVVTFLKKQDVEKDTEVNHHYLHTQTMLLYLLIDRSFTTRS